jgi:prophage regulatory protein
MRVLTRQQLKDVKGIDLSPSQIHRLRKAGKFPDPVRIGGRKTAWREDDIDKWIASRPVVGSKQDPAAVLEKAASARMVKARNKSHKRKAA